MRIQPIGKFVVVEPQKAPSPSETIVIPKEEEEMSNLGIVTEVSPEVTTVTELDIVIFGKYAGSKVKVGDEEFLVLEEKDILGVIEK